MLAKTVSLTQDSLLRGRVLNFWRVSFIRSNHGLIVWGPFRVSYGFFA